MKKNIIVQTLWIDPILGDHQRLCLESFSRLGSEVHLYTYQKVANIPDNIVVMDANEILRQSYVFKDLYNSYATFSDWFRIKLLYDRGGWWVDSDVLCIKPFDISWPYVFATEIERVKEEELIHICNCVIKMPKESDIGKSILGRIQETFSVVKDLRKIGWRDIGAKHMTTEIVNREMFDYVVSPEVFCPFDYSQYQQIFRQSNFQIDSHTFGVHLWNKMWEWSKQEPLKNIEKNSFFSKYIK